MLEDAILLQVFPAATAAAAMSLTEVKNTLKEAAMSILRVAEKAESLDVQMKELETLAAAERARQKAEVRKFPSSVPGSAAAAAASRDAVPTATAAEAEPAPQPMIATGAQRAQRAHAASLIMQPERNSSALERAGNRSQLFSAPFAHPWRMRSRLAAAVGASAGSMGASDAAPAPGR
jgi:hypothetical protein